MSLEGKKYTIIHPSLPEVHENPDVLVSREKIIKEQEAIKNLSASRRELMKEAYDYIVVNGDEHQRKTLKDAEQRFRNDWIRADYLNEPEEEMIKLCAIYRAQDELQDAFEFVKIPGVRMLDYLRKKYLSEVPESVRRKIERVSKYIGNIQDAIGNFLFRYAVQATIPVVVLIIFASIVMQASEARGQPMPMRLDHQLQTTLVRLQEHPEDFETLTLPETEGGNNNKKDHYKIELSPQALKDKIDYIIRPVVSSIFSKDFTLNDKESNRNFKKAKERYFQLSPYGKDEFLKLLAQQAFLEETEEYDNYYEEIESHGYQHLVKTSDPIVKEIIRTISNSESLQEKIEALLHIAEVKAISYSINNELNDIDILNAYAAAIMAAKESSARNRQSSGERHRIEMMQKQSITMENNYSEEETAMILSKAKPVIDNIFGNLKTFVGVDIDRKDNSEVPRFQEMIQSEVEKLLKILPEDPDYIANLLVLQDIMFGSRPKSRNCVVAIRNLLHRVFPEIPIGDNKDSEQDIAYSFTGTAKNVQEKYKIVNLHKDYLSEKLMIGDIIMFTGKGVDGSDWAHPVIYLGEMEIDISSEDRKNGIQKRPIVYDGLGRLNDGDDGIRRLGNENLLTWFKLNVDGIKLSAFLRDLAKHTKNDFRKDVLGKKIGYTFS